MNSHPSTPQSQRDDRPPLSRVFVVCSKDLQEDDLRPPFEEHGEIEDIYMPKDHHTGSSKGVAYIRYLKTSAAASAIQALHMAPIGPAQKTIKVMLASNNKNDKTDHSEVEKYNRLFVKVSKQATEEDIAGDFSNIAEVEFVRLHKDKATNESKGLAYVQFRTFLDAARAFEECDRKYKAVFATPKQDLKRTRDSYDSHYDEGFQANNSLSYKNGNSYNDFTYNNYNHQEPMQAQREGVGSLMTATNQGYTAVNATCFPVVSQRHLESLFNIVPGLAQCQYSVDPTKNECKAVLTYEDGKAAAYAVQRLNNFEFPSGEIVRVIPKNPLSKAASDLATIVDGFKVAADSGSPDLVKLADAIAQASMLIKAATTGQADLNDSDQRQMLGFCSVPLPPPQPLVHGRVAQRCFIVYKPHPPPDHILRDVFCRFGDLIDLSTFPNKTFGFAKYASIRAAEDAIKTLNQATVCHTFLKVMKADERPTKDKTEEMDTDSVDTKRMRLEAEDVV